MKSLSRSLANYRKPLSIAVLSACMLQGAVADEAAPDNGLRIATGPSTGVYTQMFRDMQKVCGKDVPLVQVPSKGGLDNLTLLSASEADLGFAQADLMMKMGKDGDQNIQELQAVMSLHANLLHILTKTSGSLIGQKQVFGKVVPGTGSVRNFQKFSDLKGATVALVGSAQLLGQTLERQVGYGMTFIEADSDDQAQAMLQSEQVHAVFSTGGWPYPPVAKLGSGNGMQLAEFDLSAPAPFRAVKRNYTRVGAYNMGFLASPNLLLTRPFKPGGERGKQVAQLQRCLLAHLDDLREGPYHAAWKEIKDPSDTVGVAAYRVDEKSGKPGRAMPKS